MEDVTCNLCAVDDTRILFKKRDKFGITEDEFSVVECKRCGLSYVNPRPTQGEMGKFYPETYSWKETLEADFFLTKWVRKLEKGYRYHLLNDEVSKVVKFTKKNRGKVLDIGCGTGDRLDTFRSRGFETYGVETSESAGFAKNYLKLNVTQGDLFTAHFPDHFFDIVTLYSVLEHTHDPIKVCEEIRRILIDDGFLIIQVPNRDSFQFKVFRKRWAAFDVPRDLYYFGTQALKRLLEKAGFEVVKTDHFMNWWHPPTLVISLFPDLDPQKAWGKESINRTAILQRMAWASCTLIAGLFTQLESVLKRGAIVTCYAMKGGVFRGRC
jgi:SAM-dependent methyltransferase